MLSGEDNAGERWKTTVGLISKKATLHVQHTFFVHFLCRCFARLQHETPRNFLVTLFTGEMSYVFSFTFFSVPLIFTLHWWPLAFLILSPPLQNFHFFLPTKKKPPLFFIYRSRSLSPFFSLSIAGLPPTFSFPLSSSCSIFQIVDMTINLSLIL